MKIFQTLLFVGLYILNNGPEVQAQYQSYEDKKIFIFDPNGESTRFQSSLSTLYDDSVFVTNVLDNQIFNYNAAFLFISNPFILNQAEGNILISYLQQDKPIYIYTKLLFQQIDSIYFWNFIGLESYSELTLQVQIDSVMGVNSSFTKGITIDTSFMSPHIPAAEGNIISILKGQGSFVIDIAYISGNDSIRIVIDQYHQIYHVEYLGRVLEYFGLVEPNNIASENPYFPNTFHLDQNFPNPFNPSTNIPYTLVRRQFINLKVYDVLANEVATLINEEKPAGNHKVEFDGNSLPTGIYFYTLTAGDYHETKKMILLK